MKNEEKEYCLVSKEILLFIEWILTYDPKLLDNLSPFTGCQCPSFS